MTSGMSSSVLENQPAAPPQYFGMPAGAMPRPQVSIERLPARRVGSEPRESMNCKSCRKRKIKCNRMRPACEACQVFQCACIYDAVPKKRGPKTDVLEALLKRVDGLEQRLKEQKKSETDVKPDLDGSESSAKTGGSGSGSQSEESPTTGGTPTSATANSQPAAARESKEAFSNGPDVLANAGESDSMFSTPQPAKSQTPVVRVEDLLDTYFTRYHTKPFYILDESAFRQRLQLNQIPPFLLHSVCALSSRYTPHPNGYAASAALGEEYAYRARSEVDTDEPSIDALQALLLLALAFISFGKGKKAFMMLTNAIGMAMALELHRELDVHVTATPLEREMRRRIFWTCYLLDRFMACGSRRPSLIGDRTILLRLPCWIPNPSSMPTEAAYFHTALNMQYVQGGAAKKAQSSSGMLIDISRILGTTNRYLAAGGVKGDSHFPWHSLSNLSKIRQDLDGWATGAQDIFSSVEVLFGQPDSSALVLSKLIYHLIHCLIYRPFLPIDLAELSGTGQHQSWQIEATHMCFLHANAIAELVELGRHVPHVEWPAMVGYCICTAGTVHVHGAHYNKAAGGGESSVFAASADFLSRELQQLQELQQAWACVHHHTQTLQSIYKAHIELINGTMNNPMRHYPVFQLEDFFDRYAQVSAPDGMPFCFDSVNLSLTDIVIDRSTDTYITTTGNSLGHLAADGGGQSMDLTPDRPGPKRQKTTLSSISIPPRNDSKANILQTPTGMPSPSLQQTPFSAIPTFTHRSPSALLSGDPQHHSIAAVAGFSQQNLQLQPSISSAPPFDTSFNFHGLGQSQSSGLGRESMSGGSRSAQNATQAMSAGDTHGGLAGYDPMFDTLGSGSLASPSAWPGDNASSSANLHHSPGDQSNDGSTGGTTNAEEKDPFLSLLEQLADNEYAHGPGTELDFFLTGASNTG